MKQILMTLFVSCALWVGVPYQAQSQNSKKLFIGTSDELLEKFSSNNQSIAARKTTSSIAINIDDITTLYASVNAAKINGGKNHFIGAIQSKKNSSFFLSIDGKKVEGNIILKEEKIAYRFSSDEVGNSFVSSVDIHEVLCIDFPKLPAEKKIQSGSLALESTTNVYALQSLPGSAFVAYMDFDGHFLSATSWNSGGPLKAEPSGMSEIDILEAWEIVSEDFKPFNINITTDESVFNNAQIGKRIRCIITPTNTAYPGSGGVAYIGSFTSASDEPCWSFTTGVGTGGKNIGEVTSHEIGHTVGLYHDGTPSENYYGGAGEWAPIMGVGYYRNVVTWSKGEYANANNSQDDIATIITQNGFGFRNDDHGNSNALATTLITGANGLVSVTQNQGIIEQQNDVDVFSFNTTGGTLDLFFNTAARHANLDILVRLYDQSNKLLALIDPSGLGAALNMTIGAGTYFIHVDGTGSGNPLTDGYSDYASLGYYYISGSIPGSGNIPPVVSIINPLNNASFTAPATITIEAITSDIDGSIAKVEFFQGSTKLGEDLIAPYTYQWSSVEAGSYHLTAKATDNLGTTTSSSSVFVSVASVSNCSGTALWNSSQIYNTAGQRVSYQGDIFENKWWTHNDTPNKNDSWGVWKFLGLCKNGNELPTVVITGPGNNSNYTAPTTVLITAYAFDADGAVSKVEFYNGNEKLGEDAMPPFVFSWANVGAGTYVLSAKATDNNGATGLSAPITILVTGNDVCSTVIQYKENGGYVAGSIVKNAENRFECKGWPYSGWCNGAAWAYAPGLGDYWQDAWTKLGSCASETKLKSATALAELISLSPNPAYEYIELDLKSSGYSSAILSVYDVMGNMLIAPSSVQNKEALNLSSLPAGIYNLQILAGSEIIHQKIVKH